MIQKAKKATLLLENGMEFTGSSVGKQGTALGEVVFSTSMTGYQEALTDPNYFGQLVVQTFPLLGNYGVNGEDHQSGRCWLKGYIIREWCELPSNFRCEGDLSRYLEQQGVVGIYDVDTRALTRLIRENGAMNGIITTEEDYDKQALLRQLAQHRLSGAVKAVTAPEQRVQKAEQEKFTVVVYDFGVKEDICDKLLRRGCTVITVPCDTAAEQVKALNPDGIVLSDGPGDPVDCQEIIPQIKALAQAGIPIFGISLGHQLLALAMGGKTEKMHSGHRGANQPVIELATGKTIVTGQNHGYVVLSDSIAAVGAVSHKNVNDGSCEGIEYRDIPAFSVQFYPKAEGGPHDTAALYDRLVTVMGTNRA